MLSAVATSFSLAAGGRPAGRWAAAPSSTGTPAAMLRRRRRAGDCPPPRHPRRAAAEAVAEPARPPATVELLGGLRVELTGRPVELPGRQGRVIFAYLAANRGRAVSRDELMEALWPAAAPAAPGAALATLLARLRGALGAYGPSGRHELSLRLPDGARVDLELVEASAARAERELANGDPRAALDHARAALELGAAPLLPELDGAWVEALRRELEELRLAAHETSARAALELGGAELPGAERCARALVRAAPYRESGHALLMEIQAARGDVAEALLSYDRLRRLLREELGAAPSPALVALNERLLLAASPLGVP